METDFRALYVDSGLNFSSLRGKTNPQIKLSICFTSFVSSSTDGRRNIATKLIRFIRVFCLTVHPTHQISMLIVGSIRNKFFFSALFGGVLLNLEIGVCGYLSHLATSETVAIFLLPTVDGLSFYFSFLLNMFDFCCRLIFGT